MSLAGNRVGMLLKTPEYSAMLARTWSPVDDMRALILASVRKSQRIGVGLQGEVYCFATEDPRFAPFLLKRIRLLHDIPGQNEASFRRKFRKSLALLPVSSALDGFNFGQPLMVDSTRNIALLIRQRGKPLDAVIATDIPALRNLSGTTLRAEARYHLYLDWVLHDVPDVALNDFAQKIMRVKASGFAIDHVKKDNIFWDAAHQRFELIDLFTRHQWRDMFDEQKRYQAIQRPVQLAYAALQGVVDPALSVQEEMFRLLTYDWGHRLQVGALGRSAQDKATSRALEERLQTRIEALTCDPLEAMVRAVSPLYSLRLDAAAAHCGEVLHNIATDYRA